MINVLKYTQKLVAASFTNRQAEEVINVLWEIMEQNLATKNDLSNIEKLLNTECKGLYTEMNLLRIEMNQLRNEIKIITERTEYRMTIKLGTMMVIGMGILGTLIKII